MRTKSAKLARRSAIVGGIAASFALALLAGCGDDKPSEPGPVATPSRSTPDSLLTSWFVSAYAAKDSAMYAAMLDPQFAFQFTGAVRETLCNRVIDPFSGCGFWGRTSDLRSTGRMFASSDVGAIRLQINPYSELESTDCTECVELRATITLEVTTDPQSPDPLVLTVNSDQVFIVRPDTTDMPQWVIFKQFDIEPPLARRARALREKREEASSVGVTSWSRIKAYFAGAVGSPTGG